MLNVASPLPSNIPSPVLTQLQAILGRDAEADCVALVWPEPLKLMDMTATVAGTPLRLIYCFSELAMREALVEHEAREEPKRLVLLSGFNQVDLAKDVLARLWRNEPQRISPWKTLQQLIKVQSIDPRLTRRHGRWMAEALLGSFERYQDKVSFGEVLDQETAWRALVLGYLDYGESAVDLPSLFEWTVRTDVSPRIDTLPVDIRANLKEWFNQGIPKYAELVEKLLAGGNADDLLAIGLACSVMFDPDLVMAKLMEDQLLYLARGRFSERYLEGESVEQTLLIGFGAEAVKTALQMLGNERSRKRLNPAMAKAEQILASLDFMPAVALSTVLPASFNQRLSIYAEQLKLAQKKKQTDPAETALQEIQTHALSNLPVYREQLERGKMALRLTEWLLTEEKSFNTSSDVIEGYIRHGGFVDWARSRIWAGDTHEGLSKVYRTLSEKIRDEREQLNESFAKHLSEIARGDELARGLVPVEHALEQIVAPIAKSRPMLLLVLDGMSQAVFREISEDFMSHNWIELGKSSEFKQCLVAALPTVTHVSRCSLLSGALKEGGASDEKKAFSQHPLLKKIASTKYPPLLFHKQELQEPGSGALADEVRAKISNTEHRVLAAVINAIDDQLSSSSQVVVDWTLEVVTLLRQVLEAARESGRVVVITSDHGHVLDRDSFYVDPETQSGERWRMDSDKVGEQEVALSGDRVVTLDHRAVLPWSERLRYTKAKSMGYHGGGSLQEVVIPLGVFVDARDSDALPGWVEVPRYLPKWWHHDSITLHDASEKNSFSSAVSKKKLTKAQQAAARMDDLFAEELDSSVPVTDSWVDQLFESDVYGEMKRRAGRAAIKDAQLRIFLDLLEKNRGQVMEAAVVRELVLPKIRLRGFLAGAQKLLNVDGYPILGVDREAETIKLNIKDLKQQFEL